MTERAHSMLSSAALPGIALRHRREARFRRLGLFAILGSLAFLAFFLTAIFARGHGAFFQTAIQLEVNFDIAEMELAGDWGAADLANANYRSLSREAMRAVIPEASGRKQRRALYGLLGAGAEFELRDLVLGQPELLGQRADIWLTASDIVDLYIKGDVSRDSASQKLSGQQLLWLDRLTAEGRVKTRFNWIFLTSGDSRDPELAGVWGAMKGTFFALAVCLVLAFVIGSMAAIYLEEFAPRNRWTDFLEININNLAAVPSITFGLLGLAIFLGFFGLPRSASLVGGMVLALMTLPTIIITSRVALQAVPPSIREAALGIGASHIQAVFHHVFPLALPGMLTGTIIGMARALGETAPLLMIGMVAFIADPPSSLTDPATALPVQVYLWADSPERGFVEKTSGAIIVLLVFLVAMNLVAVLLRKKFEKRW